MSVPQLDLLQRCATPIRLAYDSQIKLKSCSEFPALGTAPLISLQTGRLEARAPNKAVQSKKDRHSDTREIPAAEHSILKITSGVCLRKHQRWQLLTCDGLEASSNFEISTASQLWPLGQRGPREWGIWVNNGNGIEAKCAIDNPLFRGPSSYLTQQESAHPTQQRTYWDCVDVFLSHFFSDSLLLSHMAGLFSLFSQRGCISQSLFSTSNTLYAAGFRVPLSLCDLRNPPRFTSTQQYDADNSCHLHRAEWGHTLAADRTGKQTNAAGGVWRKGGGGRNETERGAFPPRGARRLLWQKKKKKSYLLLIRNPAQCQHKQWKEKPLVLFRPAGGKKADWT